MTRATVRLAVFKHFDTSMSKVQESVHREFDEDNAMNFAQTFAT